MIRISVDLSHAGVFSDGFLRSAAVQMIHLSF